MIIYYNPECSKCNEALDILQSNNCSIEIRNYLEQPPTVNELKELTALLKCGPQDITRKKEPLYLQIAEGKNLSDEELYQLLSQHPVLIERPIVIDGSRALVGRPPVLVADFIKPTKDRSI